MITLKDFLDRGYIVDNEHPSTHSRAITKGDKDYPMLSGILEQETDIQKICSKFSEAGYWYCHPGDGDWIASFIDQEAVEMVLNKGTSSLFVVVRKSDGKIYECRALMGTGSFTDTNHRVGNDDVTFGGLIKKLRNSLIDDRKGYAAGYKSMKRKLKKEYKERLAKVKAELKDL